MLNNCVIPLCIYLAKLKIHIRIIFFKFDAHANIWFTHKARSLH
jgi:hypothetical protein